MDTIGKRLTYLIETKGLNKLQFCEKYGFAYTSLNPITNDKRELGINIIKDLMKVFPNLNINWLIYGTGTTNYTKNDSLQSDMIIQEPEENYGSDPVEDMFLKYLERKSVRNKILEIISNEKKQ